MEKFLSEPETDMDEKLMIMIKMTDEISFACSLYPNGPVYPDEVSWVVKLITTIPYLEKVSTYFECGCEEIEHSLYKEKETKFGKSNPSVYLRMCHPTKCRDKDKLTFYIDIDLICYQHPISNKIIYFGASPIYHSYIEYKWIIDNNKYKTGDWAFSSNFMNQSIGMYCTPKGRSSDSNSLGQHLVLNL